MSVSEGEISAKGYFCPSQSLGADRAECLSYLESQTKTNRHKEEILNHMLLNLSNPRHDWHCMIFEAASSKGLHKWLADRRWLFWASDEQGEKEWMNISRTLVPEEINNFLSSEVAIKCRVEKNDITRVLLKEYSKHNES